MTPRLLAEREEAIPSCKMLFHQANFNAPVIRTITRTLDKPITRRPRPSALQRTRQTDLLVAVLIWIKDFHHHEPDDPRWGECDNSGQGFSPMSSDIFRWTGRCGPFDLKVGQGTFRPSTVSSMLADSLDIEAGEVVIDAGCGSGILSIIAAKLGAGMVYGTDAAEETVELATANAQAQGVGNCAQFFRGDMFASLPASLVADVVIGDVSGIPDELARVSGWFPSGLSGGPSGAELPMRMIEEAKRFLHRGGKLFLPTGSLQDEGSILSKARSTFSSIRQLSQRAIPLPSALAGHPALLRLLQDRLIELTRRGSRFVWTAKVWEITA